MKRIPFLLAASLFLFSTQIFAQADPASGRVLQKVAHKLTAVKLLGYKYRFEYRLPSQERSTIQQATAFLDLKPQDGTSQYRFQFVSDDRVDTFNGTERFLLDKKGKKLYVESKPTFNSSGSISLMNSPLSMKFALPRIIADPAISKSVTLVKSDGRDQYLIEFSLTKGVINSNGEIGETRADVVYKYQMKVDKATLLPAEVVQSNNKDDEKITTTFAEITERPSLPPVPTWFYSTFASEYALQKREKLTLIEAGKTAPEFSLAEFGKNSSSALSQLQGKLVLLEFWIAHCGFCISAVPKLNDIARKFRDKGLETVSINMYDPAATIDSFKKKNKPEFAILTGGDSIAAAYGVEAYPAFVLVDGSGKVIYSSSGLEEKELEAAIVANLKQ